jgi:hypothetical protein
MKGPFRFDGYLFLIAFFYAADNLRIDMKACCYFDNAFGNLLKSLQLLVITQVNIYTFLSDQNLIVLADLNKD